jgi:hypothetical protein
VLRFVDVALQLPSTTGENHRNYGRRQEKMTAIKTVQAVKAKASFENRTRVAP